MEAVVTTYVVSFHCMVYGSGSYTLWCDLKLYGLWKRLLQIMVWPHIVWSVEAVVTPYGVTLHCNVYGSGRYTLLCDIVLSVGAVVTTYDVIPHFIVCESGSYTLRRNLTFYGQWEG